MSDKKIQYEVGQDVFCLHLMSVGEIEIITEDKDNYSIRVYFEDYGRGYTVAEWYTYEGKYKIDDENPSLLIGREVPDFKDRLPDVS